MRSKSRLEVGEEFPVLGVYNALVSIINFYYTVSFSVVCHLIRKAILGLDVFLQHQTVLFKTGCKKTQLDTCNLAAIAESYEFRTMVIDPPKVFSEKSYKAKPITTKTGNSNKEDFEFMQNEISDLLKKGIDRCSTSPRPAQAFVVKGQKRCLVI